VHFFSVFLVTHKNYNVNTKTSLKAQFEPELVLDQKESRQDSAIWLI